MLRSKNKKDNFETIYPDLIYIDLWNELYSFSLARAGKRGYIKKIEDEEFLIL